MSLLVLLLGGLLAPGSFQDARRVAPAPPRAVFESAPVRPVEPAAAATLTELLRAPGEHLGGEFRVPVQFRALKEDWEPFLSRFEPLHWVALEVWPDEAFTWDHAVYESSVDFLFVRRGGGFEPLARRAKTHQRFEARVRVREVFFGRPWLEVIGLVPLEGELGEGTIVHVTRARELVREGQFDLAFEQYERARQAPLPPHALRALLDEIRDAHTAREQVDEMGEVTRVRRPLTGGRGGS